MKYILLIVFFLLQSICADAQKNFDFTVENVPISKALLDLAALAEMDIAFSEKYFIDQLNISLDLKSEPVETILKAILINTSIEYQIGEKDILLFKKTISKFTISGYVTDALSGERLISATIFCPKLNLGVLTNDYGFFSLTLPEGTHEINWSYIGFTEQKRKIVVNKNQRMEVVLDPSLILTEVIVRPDTNRISASFPAMEGDKILANQIQTAPDLGGEADVIKALQMLPGIATGGDGFGGLSIRGGSADQNLILLDGAPLYNGTHLLGQFSIFNANAVRSVKLLKGGFPARYGGRASSILDIRTKEGNRRTWTGSAGIGMLSANASVEGPFAGKKGGIFLAGRRTHSDFFLEPLIEKTFFNSDTDDINYHFYDLNGKVNFDLTENDRLLLSFYQGGDDFRGTFAEDSLTFGLESNSRLEWKTNLISLRWNHIFNDKIFSNTTLTTSGFASKYRFSISVDFEEELEDEIEDQFFFQDYSSDIRDWTLQTDWDYLPNPNHHIKFGLGFTNYTMNPVFTELDESLITGNITDFNIEDYEFSESFYFEVESFFAYIEDDFNLTPKLRINAGLRYSNVGEGDNFYQHLEPRLALLYSINDNWTMHASVSKMVQYLHLLVNDNLRVFSNIWIPSTDELNPQSAWQGTLGTQLKKAHFSMGIEGYYKRVDKIYKTGFFFVDGGQDFQAGHGLSYGTELFVRKDFGNWGGWINYTLSNAERSFPIFVNNVNTGNKKTPYQFDSRHQFKLFFFQKLFNNWTFTMNWQYNSATPITTFSTEDDFDFPGSPVLSSIQNERGEPNHRMDIGLNYHLKKEKTNHHFKFSIYNVYNRANPAFYLVDVEFDSSLNEFVDSEPQPVSLMPILPSVYYGIRF